MLDRSGNLFTSFRMQVAAAGAAMLMLGVEAAWPQAASAPAAPPSSAVLPPAPDPATPQGAPVPSSPPARENPGLIHEMGKLFEKSLSILPPMKSPGETIDDLNARARDAGETLSPGARR